MHATLELFRLHSRILERVPFFFVGLVNPEYLHLRYRINRGYGTISLKRKKCLT